MRRLLAVMALVLLSACQVTRMAPSGFSAQQVEILQANGFEPVGDNWELGLDNRLLFATDESNLLPAQSAMIDRMSRALLGIGIRGARVIGHTDSTGSEVHNDALSVRRAEAVRLAMVAAGMDGDAVHAEGLGARAPVESNRDAAGRSQNRRVVIIVSPADAARLD